MSERRRLRLLGSALLGLALLAAAKGPGGGGEEAYVNARFGYSIAYPAALFVAEPEAENGDGRAFHARRGGARFLVWGGFNSLDQTPGDIAAQAEDSCRRRPAAYRVVKPRLIAVSCETRTGDIFYRKTLVDGDVLVSFQMTYPRRDRVLWDPVLARISGALKAARP
jgi:hypothetical protein